MMMQENNWVSIYTTNQEYEAIIIQAILAECEIPATIMNQKDTAYGFGDISIYVPADLTIKAIDIINSNPDL
jgi:type III secretory pathway lipoprotein EscJ